MSAPILPSPVYYEPARALPASTRTLSLLATPTEGANGLTAGGTATFFLNNNGFLNPSSLVLSGQLVITRANVADVACVLGGAGYAWIKSLTTIVNAFSIETISNYNQLYHMVVNSRMDVAQKQGLSYGLGIHPISAGSVNVQANAFSDSYDLKTDAFGNATGLTVSIPFSIPIGCVLSNMSKMFPLKTSATSLQFTIAQLSEFVFGTAPSGFVLNGLALSYDITRFDGATEALIRSVAQNGQVAIKSQSWEITTQSLPEATSGSVELQYNKNYKSVKSVFAQFSPLVGVRNFGAYTVGLTQIGFQLGGLSYPEQMIDLVNRPALAFSEYCGAIYGGRSMVDAKTCCSVYSNLALDGNPDNDNPYILAKTWYGVNTEALAGSDALLSGVDSGTSSSIRMTIGTALPKAVNVSMLLQFDQIIYYDVNTFQISTSK